LPRRASSNREPPHLSKAERGTKKAAQVAGRTCPCGHRVFLPVAIGTGSRVSIGGTVWDRAAPISERGRRRWSANGGRFMMSGVALRHAILEEALETGFRDTMRFAFCAAQQGANGAARREDAPRRRGLAAGFAKNPLGHRGPVGESTWLEKTYGSSRVTVSNRLREEFRRA